MRFLNQGLGQNYAVQRKTQLNKAQLCIVADSMQEGKVRSTVISTESCRSFCNKKVTEFTPPCKWVGVIPVINNNTILYEIQFISSIKLLYILILLYFCFRVDYF